MLTFAIKWLRTLTLFGIFPASAFGQSSTLSQLSYDIYSEKNSPSWHLHASFVFLPDKVLIRGLGPGSQCNAGNGLVVPKNQPESEFKEHRSVTYDLYRSTYRVAGSQHTIRIIHHMNVPPMTYMSIKELTLDITDNACRVVSYLQDTDGGSGRPLQLKPSTWKQLECVRRPFAAFDEPKQPFEALQCKTGPANLAR